MPIKNGIPLSYKVFVPKNNTHVRFFGTYNDPGGFTTMAGQGTQYLTLALEIKRLKSIFRNIQRNFFMSVE